MKKIQMLSLLLWLVMVVGIQAAYDDGELKYPLKQLCRRWDHQTAVLDNTLYLVGGRVIIKETLQKKLGNRSSTWEGEPSQEFISLDLTTSFSLEKRIKGAEKSDQSTLLSFDIAAAKWSRETAWDNPDGSTPNRFAKGTSVNVPEIGMGFYVGGARMYAGADGEREWRYPVEQQMVGMDIGGGNYDAQYQEIMEGTMRAMGAGVTWIPVGDKGSLVMFGGTNDTETNEVSPLNGNDLADKAPKNTTLESNARVHIYDIAKDRWHVQLSQGDVPVNRMHACAVAATSPDKKSHQIYFYGGGTGSRMFGMDDSRFMGDLYVLNIPAFKWQRFTDLKNPPAARSRHTCHVINKRQMLIVGGSRNDSFTVQAQWCRWDEISVLDMTDLRWELQYVPATLNYSVNPKVYENSLVNTVPMDTPSLGWTDAGVQQWFAANDAGLNDDAEDKPGLAKGALIGIIVGAVAVVLILAVVGFMLWKRRKNAKLEEQRRGSEGLQEPYTGDNVPGSPLYDQKHGGLSPGFPQGEFGDAKNPPRFSELGSEPSTVISEMPSESRTISEMPASPVFYELPTGRSPTHADLYGGGYLSETSRSPISDLSQPDHTQAGTHIRAMSPVSPATVLEDITSVVSGPGTVSSSSLPRHDEAYYPTRDMPPH
ncbi:uncharacterized protein LAJ45_05020 [Morchella importuna]|uniref:uncharacterized protein n=1 Tax=Morchella importuna TaxID=1174673 RepID=UPI001E8E7925|nr:uncharacterized protein LAJ45_05020 [Morchella importuna]KAH8150839.1 hypothetical protein LAJ45_05020 [Morchella importuna]